MTDALDKLYAQYEKVDERERQIQRDIKALERKTDRTFQRKAEIAWNIGQTLLESWGTRIQWRVLLDSKHVATHFFHQHIGALLKPYGLAKVGSVWAKNGQYVIGVALSPSDRTAPARIGANLLRLAPQLKPFVGSWVYFAVVHENIDHGCWELHMRNNREFALKLRSHGSYDEEHHFSDIVKALEYVQDHMPSNDDYVRYLIHGGDGP
jgi:hypothetical protein